MPSPHPFNQSHQRLHVFLQPYISTQSRQFWQAYMKNKVPFLGIRMAHIRLAVHQWWQQEGSMEMTAHQGKNFAYHLLKQTFGEEKLAAILLLDEILGSSMSHKDLLRIGTIFRQGFIQDWNTCDWICLKVLGRYFVRTWPNQKAVALILSWRQQPSIWQQRASLVTFVRLIHHSPKIMRNLRSKLFRQCNKLAPHSERFIQTAIGWLLREIYHHHPEQVIIFLQHHQHIVSRECMRYATEKMSQAQKNRCKTFGYS